MHTNAAAQPDVVVASAQRASARAGFVPLGVHLVGSVPLSTAAEVFSTLGAGLGDRLRRLPDGETGPRADWIVWQYPVLSSRASFEVAPPEPHSYRALPRLRLRRDGEAPDLEFEQLGYAEAAVASFRVFATLKRDGVVPRGCRFQVSLPTPLAPVSAFVALDDQSVVEPAYERAMLADLARMLEEIPHDQLALQWDTNFEFGMLEGDVPAWFPDVRGGILERLLRISSVVPPAVELGFHFCSGHDEARPRTVPGRPRAHRRPRERARGGPRATDLVDPHARAARARTTRRSSHRSQASGSRRRPSSTWG